MYLAFIMKLKVFIFIVDFIAYRYGCKPMKKRDIIRVPL